MEGKTITIEVAPEYKIVGIVIEYNSFTRHLTLTPNDLAYTCDIEALDKKITALAEQSHLNDAAMVSIQEEYATIDEVNEVLANNYVLKSDISEYRKKDDLSIKTIVNLPIEHKRADGIHDFVDETAFVEFHEGALLEGYVIVFDNEIEDIVHIDFSITFHTDNFDHDIHTYYTNISKIEVFQWNEKTKLFHAGGDVEFAVHLNSAKLYIDDTFALKSENDQLKSKIATLEARIAALENK